MVDQPRRGSAHHGVIVAEFDRMAQQSFAHHRLRIRCGDDSAQQGGGQQCRGDGRTAAVGGRGLPCRHRLPQPVREEAARRDAHDRTAGIAIDHRRPVPGLTEVEGAQRFHGRAAVSPHIRITQPRQPAIEDRRLQLPFTLAGRTVQSPGQIQGHLGVIGDDQPLGEVRAPQIQQRQPAIAVPFVGIPPRIAIGDTEHGCIEVR